MPFQSGPRPRSDRGDPSTSDELEARTGEHPTANWLNESGPSRSSGWGDEDDHDDAIRRRDASSHTKLHTAKWLAENEDGPTARRSVARLPFPSTPWEPVNERELIPSAHPPRSSSIPPTAPSPMIGSVGPVSMEASKGAGNGDVTELRNGAVDLRSGTFFVRGRLLAGALAAGAALGVALYVGQVGGFGGRGAEPAPSPPVAAAAPPAQARAVPFETPPPPPAPAAAAAEEPKAAPMPAPPKETGTVIGSAGHRLYVDGHQVASWKVDVKCGKHTARNGSHGAVRTVTVPCGGDIEIAP
jgi:hypothetical protein